MAYFVELDDNDVVIRSIFVENDVINNLPFPESESLGQEFLESLGLGTNWLQTSFNANFRGRYASEGIVYDRENDVFVRSPEEPVEDAP